jgi:hypothetical protein
MKCVVRSLRLGGAFLIVRPAIARFEKHRASAEPRSERRAHTREKCDNAGPSTRATLLDDLKHLVEPVTLGDPKRPLLWVSKSLVPPSHQFPAGVAMSYGAAPATVGVGKTERGLPHRG